MDPCGSGSETLTATAPETTANIPVSPTEKSPESFKAKKLTTALIAEAHYRKKTAALLTHNISR